MVAEGGYCRYSSQGACLRRRNETREQQWEQHEQRPREGEGGTWKEQQRGPGAASKGSEGRGMEDEVS